jgi:hypothetical protein
LWYVYLRKIFAAQKSGGQVPLMLCVCYVFGCVLGAFVLTTVFKNYVQVLRWWNKTLYTGWKAILFLLRPLSCIKRRSHLRFVIIKFHTNNWFEKQHWKTKVAERKTFFQIKMMEAQIKQTFTIIICSLPDNICFRFLLPRLHYKYFLFQHLLFFISIIYWFKNTTQTYI